MNEEQLRHRIAWPLRRISPDAWLRLHPEWPDFGPDRLVFGEHTAGSDPMPGLIASYFVALSAQRQIAHALPEGPQRTQMLGALNAAIADAIDEVCGTPHPPPPHHFDTVIEAALELKGLASMLGGELRSEIGAIASNLGARAAGAMFAEKG